MRNAAKHVTLPLLLAVGLLSGATVPSAAQEAVNKSAWEKLAPMVLEDMVRWAEYESSNPLLTDEFSDYEREIEAEIRAISVGKKIADQITVVADRDFILGGSAPETLILFLNPACVHCTNGFRFAVENNDFSKRNIVVKFSPSIELNSLTASMYVWCKANSVNDLYRRMYISNQILSKEFDKYSHHERVDALAKKFELSLGDLEECRTMEMARHHLSSLLELYRQCPRTGCSVGYVQTSVRGLVIEAYTPSTPAWFIGRMNSHQHPEYNFKIERGGTGIDSLMKIVSGD